MFVAPAVAWEISPPPTTPRGTSRSTPDGLTTLMGRAESNPATRPRARRSSGRHAGELPARDVEHLPVDVVRPRRAEEEHAAGGLLRAARAPQRDQHGGHAAHLVRDPELDLLAADLHDVVGVLGRGQPGLDVAERDRV